jgi:hypothetical protein
MNYLIVEIPDSVAKRLGLVESIWKQSDYPDLFYRVDAARPEMKIRRHVAIAHKKHIKSPTKQVSWNDDNSKHDKGNFDHSFKGIEKAKDIARTVLKLGDDVVLEWATATDKRRILNESVSGNQMLVEGNYSEILFLVAKFKKTSSKLISLGQIARQVLKEQDRDAKRRKN